MKRLILNFLTDGGASDSDALAETAIFRIFSPPKTLPNAGMSQSAIPSMPTLLSAASSERYPGLVRTPTPWLSAP